MDNKDESNSFVLSDASVRAKITKLNQLSSPFLKLPAEIRNVIYELLCTDGIVVMRFCESTSYYGAFQLLRTCRQIRFELLPIFYRHTTFFLGRPHPSAVEWRLFPFNGTSIKSVLLFGDDQPEEGVCEFDMLMPNVEHIYVYIEAVAWERRQRFAGVPLETQTHEREASSRIVSGNRHVKLHYIHQLKTFRRIGFGESEVSGN